LVLRRGSKYELPVLENDPDFPTRGRSRRIELLPIAVVGPALELLHEEQSLQLGNSDRNRGCPLSAGRQGQLKDLRLRKEVSGEALQEATILVTGHDFVLSRWFLRHWTPDDRKQTLCYRCPRRAGVPRRPLTPSNSSIGYYASFRCREKASFGPAQDLPARPDRERSALAYL
jgi:hypothetical protein